MLGRFVSNRLASLVLISVSLSIWLVCAFIYTPQASASFFGYEFGDALQHCLTFICILASSLVMSLCHLFERRIHWLFSQIVALASASVFVHASLENSLVLLMFSIMLYRILSCQQGEDNRRAMFVLFTLFGTVSVFSPKLIAILPVLVIYLFVSGLVGTKGILSVFLGLLTPFWFLFGITYIFPQFGNAVDYIKATYGYMHTVTMELPSMFNVIVAILDISIIIPFAILFGNSSVPGKPFLRKRLRFTLFLDVCLLLLSLLFVKDFEFYYMLSLPLKGVMISYIYSLPITRFTRYYFIYINTVWLMLVPISLWLKH